MHNSTKPSLPAISQIGKSTLARLLANENITIIHDNTPTASFDLKNRLLRLPNWAGASRELNDMLVGHEVSHALHTPMEAWRDGIDRIEKETGKAPMFCKTYLNIVEDARIERLIKIKFPGLRRDFFIAYEALIKMEIFGDISKPQTMNLGDRLNLHFKLGIHRGMVIPFAPEEKQWLVKMDNTSTFEEVVVLTIAIIKSLKEASQPQSNKKQEVEMESGEGEESEASDESDSAPDAQGGKGKSNAKSAKTGESEEKSKQESVGDTDGGTTSTDSEDCVQCNSPQDQPKTNDMMDKNIAEKLTKPHGVSESAPAILRSKVPASHDVVVHWSTILQDVRAGVAATVAVSNFSAPLLTPIKIEEYSIASRTMASAFNRRKSADVFKRSSIARTGNLDTLRMNQYRWCDDVFRRTVKVAEGKNHGICILVDWSSSMSRMLKATIGQVIILTDFCRMSNIPFEVYAFTDRQYVSAKTGMSDGDRMKLHEAMKAKYKKDTTSINPISLLNFLSSTMNKTDYEYAKSFFFNIRELSYQLKNGNNFGLSGTPTCAALYEMSYVVREFRAKSNVQVCHTVVLTDGDAGDSATPNDEHFASLNADGTDAYKLRYGSQGVMDDPMTGESYDIRQIHREWTRENQESSRSTFWSFGSVKIPAGVQNADVWIACDILRRRTGSKIHWIGLRDGGCSAGNHGVTQNSGANWKRDGFLRGTTIGFDSTVIVNSDRFVAQPASLRSIKSVASQPVTLTKGQLQKSFIESQCESNCFKMIASIVGAEIGTS
jgi:hypothetical protein